jgi:hypothetical protein
MPRRWLLVLGACAVAGAVLVLFMPVLSDALIGDDYQWIQLARQARSQPGLLLADLDTYYRPTTTWSLVADDWLWGGRATGFRATNLALHAVVGILLLLVAARLGLGPVGSAAVALLWVCSPFAAEPALAVAIRFEDILLITWLGLVLAWPRGKETWSSARYAAVAACTVLAALSKETWVVTPGLMVALELAHRPRDRWRSRRVVLLAAGAVVVFMTTYFLIFPGTKGYGTPSLTVLWKVPEQMAAFLFLRPPAPVAFSGSWIGAIAILVTVALLVAAVSWRPAPGWLGAALLAAPMLPTLLVPFLPLRYMAIPYAGFLLVVGGAAQGLGARLGPSARRVGSIALAALVGLVLTAQAAVVRAECRDLERIAAWHQRLLDEAAAVTPGLPLGQPVAVVRAEADNPLKDIALAPQGWPKLLYVRAADPYGLIDAAALFDWDLAPRTIGVRDVVRGDTPVPPGSGRILVHRRGGFEWRGETPDLRGAVTAMRGQGMAVKVIVATHR